MNLAWALQPPCNKIQHCVTAHATSSLHRSSLMCLHFCLLVLTKHPFWSSVTLRWCRTFNCRLGSYFQNECVWRRAEVVVNVWVCFCACTHPFFVGHGCFINSCLRFLACASGGETSFLFCQRWAGQHVGGRGTTPASYVYIQTIYRYDNL